MINTRLIEVREKRQLRQVDAAKLLSISAVTYNRYEKGEREPDHSTLSKLASFFNVSTDYLLGRTDIPEPIDSYIKKTSLPAVQTKPSQMQLTDDEQAMLTKYRQLPEKMKGRIEERIDMEIERQKEKTPPEAKRA